MGVSGERARRKTQLFMLFYDHKSFHLLNPLNFEWIMNLQSNIASQAI
jgi:hypothetical protein